LVQTKFVGQICYKIVSRNSWKETVGQTKIMTNFVTIAGILDCLQTIYILETLNSNTKRT